MNSELNSDSMRLSELGTGSNTNNFSHFAYSRYGGSHTTTAFG